MVAAGCQRSSRRTRPARPASEQESSSRFGATVSRSKVGADRVPAVTVDELAATYGQPDLLWIDVEG